jgi:hypothetical protein
VLREAKNNRSRKPALSEVEEEPCEHPTANLAASSLIFTATGLDDARNPAVFHSYFYTHVTDDLAFHSTLPLTWKM